MVSLWLFFSRAPSCALLPLMHFLPEVIQLMPLSILFSPLIHFE
jgi:hypothetical protein